MRLPRLSKAPTPSGPDRRVATRWQTPTVSCDLGAVADLSVTGMRIDCVQHPGVKRGDAVRLELRAGAESIPVEGWVVRVIRKGLRSHQVCVRFGEMTPALKQALESLGKFGFIRGATSAGRKRPGGGAAPLRAAMSVPDYYKLLGVPPTASQGEIQESYRRLARKYHPDLNKEPSAEQRFAQIAEAYRTLGDPERRQAFDSQFVAA